ncbi:MAG: bestrophin family protein [Planctomycetaceae bacterium]
MTAAPIRVREMTIGRTLWRVTVYALLIGAYALIPVLKESHPKSTTFADLPSDLHAALTIVLGWLLVFRTNSSYGRWWEARQLWGSLVNVSRNLAIKVADLVRASDDEMNRFRVDIVAFAYGLKDHLREESLLQKLPGFENCTDRPSHVPSYLITRMYEEFSSWKTNGSIDGDELRVLDEEARRFLDICGGCERIRKTQVVRSYKLFARQCVFLYLATFPWGIVDSFRWWTIPLTVIVAYFMLGLEIVAEHVEEPFGYDEDDLDLEGLCRTIEVTVQEVFDRRLARKAQDVVA